MLSVTEVGGSNKRGVNLVWLKSVRVLRREECVVCD